MRTALRLVQTPIMGAVESRNVCRGFRAFMVIKIVKEPLRALWGVHPRLAPADIAGLRAFPARG
jgi:hypothetical protein